MLVNFVSPRHGYDWRVHWCMSLYVSVSVPKLFIRRQFVVLSVNKSWSVTDIPGASKLTSFDIRGTTSGFPEYFFFNWICF